MQDKIIAAIYKVLRREIENEDGFSFGTDLSEIATEIAAAIAPFLEAGGSDDSQYTDDFLKWRKKYFTTAKPQLKRFVSKQSGVYFEDAELESRYQRAYKESPIK